MRDEITPPERAFVGKRLEEFEPATFCMASNLARS